MNGKRNGKNPGERHGLAARVIAKLGRPVIRRISELARESLNEPGSWRCLEMIYRNQPVKLLDRVFLGSRSARGARSRLNVLEDEICRAIERRATLRNWRSGASSHAVAATPCGRSLPRAVFRLSSLGAEK